MPPLVESLGHLLAHASPQARRHLGDGSEAKPFGEVLDETVEGDAENFGRIVGHRS